MANNGIVIHLFWVVCMSMVWEKSEIFRQSKKRTPVILEMPVSLLYVDVIFFQLYGYLIGVVIQIEINRDGK